MNDRNDTIKQIRDALKRRSGKPWSVTGGRGTAYGWIRISAPPSRCTAHYVLRPGVADWPENYEEYINGTPNGHMTPEDRAELGRLLGLGKPVHCQGESVPAHGGYYQEYIDRANGRTPTIVGERYWD